MARKSSTIDIFFCILYMCFAIPMFYFIDGSVYIGGFGFMYHYLCGLGIVLLGFIKFMISPDLTFIGKISNTSFVLSLSYIAPIIISMFIWAFEAAKTSMMIKGMFCGLYVIIAVFVSMNTIYVLKSKAVLFSCIAMSIANVMIIVPVATEGGIMEFMSELVALIVTFGEDTGPLMKSIEIHDLTFAFGLYLMYAIINKELYRRKTVFILSFIFTMTGLKRIAIAGIALAAVIYWLLVRCSKKTIKYIGLAVMTLTIIISFIYITAVQKGLFDYLELKGLDTKGRNLIYGYVSQLCEISPSFIGHGLGFSNEDWVLPLYSRLHQDAYHNEFLRMFVELGFFGYFIWIFINLPFRFLHIVKTQNKKGVLLFLGMVLYCYITYATDNTYYYYYMNMAVFILTMYPLTKKILNQEDRLMKNYVDVNDE